MKANHQLVLFLLAFILFFGASSSEVVQLDDGSRINGTTMSSRMGNEFHAFYRIPFAEPPLGNLRFEPPQPAKPWADILDGTAYGPMCVQANAVRPIDEDCLQLNVFTKSLTELKPVIFDVFGGGFVIGGAINQKPDYLMDRDVVVVTFNYRVGALGFLSTGTKEAPGNAGLKDQALALQWVHKNIAKFGGDPTRITISGLSAGSASVTALMVSPMVEKLFVGVIALSGSIVGKRSMRRGFPEAANKLAEKLQCPTDKVDEMINCLRTKPALEIVNTDVRGDYTCEGSPWRPVLENEFGQTRFFVDDPAKLFRDGNFAKVPLMIGRTTVEIVSSVPALLARPNLNENIDEIVANCLAYEETAEKSIAFFKLLREEYLPFETIDQRSFTALNNLYADALGYGIHKLVNLVSSQVDVYYYEYSYVGRHSYYTYPRDLPYGAHHADDLQFVFFTDFIGPFIQPDDPEGFMVERMTSIWEQFAWTGNPNNNSNAIWSGMNWPKHNSSHEFYMDWGTHMIEKNGLHLKQYKVWEMSSASIVGAKIMFVILIAAFTLLY